MAATMSSAIPAKLGCGARWPRRDAPELAIDEGGDGEEQDACDASGALFGFGGIRARAEAPEDDDRGEKFDGAIAAEAEEGGAARGPCGEEGDEGFDGHPGDGENLEADDAAERGGGGRDGDGGHWVLL